MGLQDETLFYMFYSMPGDEAQLIAADELSVRGWLYHKRWKVWLMAAPNTTPTKGQRGERGTYNVWDIQVREGGHAGSCGLARRRGP